MEDGHDTSETEKQQKKNELSNQTKLVVSVFT